MAISEGIYKIINNNNPILATAIHAGHEARPEVKELFNLSSDERLREEDPFTDKWTTVSDTRILGHHSRFELDLNRSRDKAVYQKPEDAWCLQVWKDGIPEEQVQHSLKHYDQFYAEIKQLLEGLVQEHGCFVVLDLHSYNHRRNGADAPPESAEENPEINIGTGNINMELWGPLVQRFVHDLRSYNYNGRHLDVRENVKFNGGHFMRWINENFHNTGCAIAIEFKKFFMDEWTGEPDQDQIIEIEKLLKSTLPGLMEERKKICGEPNRLRFI
ncbi:MAG: N-formylglutamate amidohydrolase [Hymenobacteraceae bacterium]|nr:N-formylglutamate amidohydrolase [Hymenobacteraceae bacterium]MDX5395341.1 N-formylglutamate amidohydrolase [Hymenobacteraceae bacterium]MDX5511392.1 N-formylglutamate amidohydrolase [Hymenobacteraceae bacterium]